MKKEVIFKVCFIFCLTTVSILYANPVNITFAYQNTNNYPYQTQNSNTTNWDKPGTLVEMLKIVEKNMNIKISFIRVPWKRALFDLRDGTVDGLFEASYKEKRLKYGLYPTKNNKIDETRRTNYNSYFVYKLKDSELSWDGTSFKNNNQGICAEREYSIVDDLRNKGVIVHEFNTTTKCMELLSNGRVDGVAALELAGDSILNQNKNMFKNIIKVEPALKTKVYYLMFSHQFIQKYPKFSEEIWDMVEKVRESQEMKIINRKYFQ